MVTFRLNNKSISLDLPDIAKRELDFPDSAFFTFPNRRLPAPAEVRVLCNATANVSRPTTVRFGDLDLIVKFGPHVTTLEALNLWVVKKYLKTKSPSPRSSAGASMTRGMSSSTWSLSKGQRF
ncbi:hypothetical protein BJX68DRAFT_227802 [Aspergillus pseudodeflectus]|uniref:Uncharacterized protein n=1 Tax=Aspergillus pseudodeflectus TaxID=176178 RepID=A0ABR4L3F6_9EURO